MTNMTDLIQRLTDATGNERGLFEEAFELLREPEPQIWRADAMYEGHTSEYAAWCERGWAFDAMLDAEAWTSAAEMLVPPDHPYDLISGREVPEGNWLCFVGSGKGEGRSMARASTPALALLIAALKAHGGNDAE